MQHPQMTEITTETAENEQTPQKVTTSLDQEEDDRRMDEEADEKDEIAWRLINGKEWGNV